MPYRFARYVESRKFCFCLYRIDVNRYVGTSKAHNYSNFNNIILVVRVLLTSQQLIAGNWKFDFVCVCVFVSTIFMFYSLCLIHFKMKMTSKLFHTAVA